MIKLKKYLIKNFDKVKINSQYIFKGDVFIALKGKNKHGNEYIEDALNKGAKYIITDTPIKNKKKFKNIIIVKNTLCFLLKIANHKRKLFKGNVIGITGSVGKTSVKENLKYFLSFYTKVSASIKSYNNYLGVIISLINIDLKSNFAIFELGTNSFSEIKKLTSIIMPSQIIITNIFPTHLEKLINTRNIAIEKSDIFNIKYNPNIKLAILSNSNIDEKFIIKLAKKQPVSKIITFGNDAKSDLRINKIKKINNKIIKISINYEDQIFNIIINHNQLNKVNNIFFCFLIFKYNNFSIDTFLSMAKQVPLLEGRGLHNVITINNKKINFIDESYNASPVTMKMCINYFVSLKLRPKQKKFLILGDMKELGTEALKFHVELLAYIQQKKIKNVIICGELMQLALDKLSISKIKCIMNIRLIIKYLEKFLNNEDIILIKGSNSSSINKLTQEFLNKGDIIV